jgi:formiminoglutamase
METFDGEPLYKSGSEPGPAEVLRRRAEYFDPYHAALSAELERTRTRFGCVVLYDAHSIRSRVPRLFEGALPQFNIGTNNGVTCDAALTTAIEKICDASGFTRVSNGRFRGGYITRHSGNPAGGIHAVQMELSMAGYLHEPQGLLNKSNWPAQLDDALAARLRVALRDILDACIAFAEQRRT